MITISGSIREIAKNAGVSVSTVSRVINGKDRVSSETRDKVNKALEALDYKPNEMARVLRGKKSNTIGIVVSDISNNFFAKLIKGAERAAMAKGYNVLVCSTNSDCAKELECIELLISKQVSGIIVASVGFESGLENHKDEIPIVYIDNLPRHTKEFNSVSIDNLRASRRLTEYLITKGHRDIAILAGNLMESTGQGRLAGWKNAMSESGLTIHDHWILTGEFSIESGYRCMEKLLAQKARPTAVLAANNTIAYGAMLALRQNGYDVPGDVSIAAFDADDETGLITPKLTTVNQPVQEFGRVAVDICLHHIGKEGQNHCVKTVLPYELIEGDSVKLLEG